MFYTVLYNYFEKIDTFSLIFFIISNVIIINTILSYFSNNPVVSLLYLVLNYILVSFIFIYSGYVFLSIVFLIIYIGAVSILLLFTFMLLDFKTIYYKNLNFKFLYFFIISIFTIEFLYMLIFKYYIFKTDIYYYDDEIYINYFDFIFDENETLNLGYELFVNNYNIFFILGLFLLSVLIASVSIVVSKKISKKQNLYTQLKQYNNNIINV